MDSSPNQIFEDLTSEIYNSTLHSSQHEVGGVHALEQPNILDVANMNNEEYRLVFPYYRDDGNEIIINCDKQFQQFNSEMYTIHVPESKITDTELIFIQEENNIATSEDIENLNVATLLFAPDNLQSNESKNVEENLSPQQCLKDTSDQCIAPKCEVQSFTIPEENTTATSTVAATSTITAASMSSAASTITGECVSNDTPMTEVTTAVTEELGIPSDTAMTNATTVIAGELGAPNDTAMTKVSEESKMNVENESEDEDNPGCSDDLETNKLFTMDDSDCNLTEESQENELLDPKILNVLIPVTEKNIFALHGIDVSFPINCDVCSTSFNDMELFDNHMKAHIENRHFMCQLCPKSYVSWENLVAHRKADHQAHFISCDNCSCRKHFQNLGPLRFPIGKFPSGCEECNKGFNNSAQLNKHYRCHMSDNCEKEKLKKSTVKNIIPSSISTSSQVNEKEFETSDPSTSGIQSFEQHKTSTFKCDQCSKELSSAEAFESHQKWHQKSELKYKCTHCNSVFKDLNSYKTHQMTHKVESKIASQKNSKKLTSKESNGVNQTNHQTIEEYYCFNCQMDFNTPREVQRHIEKVHYQRPDVKLTCNFCSFKYPVNQFMNHYLICAKNKRTTNVGRDGSNLTCHVCGDAFLTSIDLQYHVKTHCSEKQTYMCEICGIVLHECNSFSKHLLCHSPYRTDSNTEILTSDTCTTGKGEVGNDVASYMCEYCGREFKKKTNLQCHIRRHTGGKPYQCNYCSKAFYTGSQLSVHIRQHTGERPYVCNVCKKSFSSSTVLYTHKKMHTSNAQHICSICGKKFVWRSAYQNHLRIHSNIRPYKCEICFQTFSFRNRLTAHLRRHEEGKLSNFNFVLNQQLSIPLTFQCSDCGQSFPSSQELESHHEEKCYLTMITFLPPANNSNKTEPSLLLLDANNDPNLFCDLQQVAF